MVNILSDRASSNSINDIFIISHSGIPYYTGCFGGETCTKYPDHLLQTGFIAALFQYSKEFGQSNIREVFFDESKLMFEVNKIANTEIIIVFHASHNISSEHLRRVVSEATQMFIKKFSDKVIENQGFIKTSDYKQFSEVLKELKSLKKAPLKEISLLKDKSFRNRIVKLL